MHDGKIGAISDGVGSGTMFYFDLPVYKVKRTSNYNMNEEIDEESGTSKLLDASDTNGRKSSLRSIYSVNFGDANAEKDSIPKCSPTNLEGEGYISKTNNSKIYPLQIDRESFLIIDGSEKNDIETPTKDSFFKMPIRKKSFFGNSMVFAESDLNPSDDVVRNANEEKISNLIQSKTVTTEDSRAKLKKKQKIDKLTSFISENEDDCNHRVNSGKSWETGLHFLIVDDTMTNRKMTVKMLNNLGHSVDQAVDGKDFLLKIAEEKDFSKYDVVLMDDNMPSITGQEATVIARKQGYRGVIYGVTGNTSIDQVQSFLLSGADKVFAKPLNVDLLKKLIQKNILS
jgi:CheY-like chemotaxis protein